MFKRVRTKLYVCLCFISVLLLSVAAKYKEGGDPVKLLRAHFFLSLPSIGEIKAYSYLILKRLTRTMILGMFALYTYSMSTTNIPHAIREHGILEFGYHFCFVCCTSVALCM